MPLKKLLEAVRRRPLRFALVLVGLVLAGWWAVSALQSDVDGDWVEVERDDLVLGVAIEGTLRATDTSSLGPPQLPWLGDYKISMMAPEGNEVKQGDPVLGFDTSELQRRLQEKLAESEEAQKEIDKELARQALDRRQDELRLAEARARLRKAKLKVDVPEELTKAQELRTARLDLELAEREIAYLEERLDSARRGARSRLGALRSQKARADERVQEYRDAIESMTVKAPRDGTVIYASNWRDEKKKVGDSCWRGENVLEIPDLRKMMARGEIDEADAARVHRGQPLNLRLDAHPDEEFSGKVDFIYDTVQNKSWRNPTKIVRLEVELDHTDTQRMRPGMRFRGNIETERIEQALVLPIEAVFLSGHEPVAYRKTLLGWETVPIELGRRDGGLVEVLDGLSEGDRVARIDLARLEREGDGA